jgi:hypothetical protein
MVAYLHTCSSGQLFVFCMVLKVCGQFLITLLLSAVSESLDELVSAIAYRLGTGNEKANVNIR